MNSFVTECRFLESNGIIDHCYADDNHQSSLPVGQMSNRGDCPLGFSGILHIDRFQLQVLQVPQHRREA
jgi:hypothetical protein